MKKFRIDQGLNVNPPQVVGLTKAQHARRAHCLTEVKASGLPEGITAYQVSRTVQFKIGEVIYAEDLPKNLAALVSDPDASGAESAGQGEAGKADAAGDGAAKPGKAKPVKAKP